MDKKIKFLPDKDTFKFFLYKRLDTVNIKNEEIDEYLNDTFKHSSKRFSLIKNKYFQDDNYIYFRTGHYCQFFILIYELTKIIYLKEKNDLCEKLFFLNTVQSNLDIYYTTNLPKKFFLVHPFASIVGSRTIFKENSSLIIYNNCNLGRNTSDDHPIVEGNLIMLPNSSIVGKCFIKGNVILSNGSYLNNPGEIKDKIVFGRYPNNIYKDIKQEIFDAWNEFI